MTDKLSCKWCGIPIRLNEERDAKYYHQTCFEKFLGETLQCVIGVRTEQHLSILNNLN